MISFAPEPAPPRHICLILEGGDPFASGGVSTWLRQMTEAMPDLEFSIHCISGPATQPAESTSRLTPNVISVTTSSLRDCHDPLQSMAGRGSRSQKAEFLHIVRAFLHAPDMPARLDALCRAATVLHDQPGMVTLADLLEGKASRQLLTEHYQTWDPQNSFRRSRSTVHDFVTMLWTLLRTATTLPGADVYHGMSSGYAGFLGALASRLHNAPFLLGVHGADLTERIEGIRRSTRLAPPPGLTAPFAGNLGPCKSLWIGFFELLGRLARTRADCVTVHCQSQARFQIELGAPSQRVTVIPNGIDAMRFASIARKKLQAHPAHERRITVGFLGRLVPVKDIKTLLRAARLVLKAHPETRFLLAGPHDADPEYFAECRALAERTGISQSVEFPGPMSPDAFLRRCDIVTLTSIDEGMPFAVLEASGAGLPVVAPDVGACRAVIAEQLPGHPTLGPSGFITEVASPVSTANALKQLVASADLRFEQGMNGLRRVQSAYRQEFIVDRYHKLYHALAASPSALGPAGT